MGTSVRKISGCLLALLALAHASFAPAASNFSAVAPHTAKSAQAVERLLSPGAAPTTLVVLALPDAAQIESARQANAAPGIKRLQIGIGRDVPASRETQSTALLWVPVDGGMAARWEVVSPGARAMRIGLAATGLAAGHQIRFAGEGGEGTVYGPFLPEDVGAMGPTFWSPVLEGDSAVVEIFVAASQPAPTAHVSIVHVSHLFVSPRDADAERLAKAAQFCEVDLICLSASNAALASVGKAVARMAYSDPFGSYLCTGTLLNPTGGSFIPYFYSAYHCIGTQAVANTLTTHWFYDRTTCSPAPGGTSPSYTQLPGGAQLLYGNQSADALLLRLNNSPPAGAVFAGWTSNTLVAGTALTGVHHPAGDLKKVSLATMGGFATQGGGSFIISNWNSIATGVTEGGSSGSGIFTSVGSPASDYRLRGGLLGGPSSCSAGPGSLYDHYSRFDQVYPSISQYLNPLQADLSLVQSINANPASAGKDAVITMAVTNNGPDAATGVAVTAAHDPAATAIWVSPGCVAQGAPATYVCSAGTLANGASVQFKLVLRKNAAGSVYNNAGVSSAVGDPNPANNSPSLSVTVNATPAGTPVLRYRLYSDVTKEHHFTTDLNEYTVLGTYVGTWVQEGTVGRVLNNPGVFNGVTAAPYYRLYDTSTQWHHWTTDANEYYTLIQFPWWNGEGVDGYILPTDTTGAIQLYRLLYPFIAGLHHWTIDTNEYSVLTTSYGWIGEGGSGFVIQ